MARAHGMTSTFPSMFFFFVFSSVHGLACDPVQLKLNLSLYYFPFLRPSPLPCSVFAFFFSLPPFFRFFSFSPRSPQWIPCSPFPPPFPSKTYNSILPPHKLKPITVDSFLFWQLHRCERRSFPSRERDPARSTHYVWRIYILLLGMLAVHVLPRLRPTIKLGNNLD